MTEVRGGFVDRLVSWVGVTALWAFIAVTFDAVVLEWLRVAGAQGGVLSPRGGWDLWLRPTTVVGSVLFLLVAALFARMCMRAGLPPWLVMSAMGAMMIGLWAWAALRAYDMSVLYSFRDWAHWLRYAAPLSVSSTLGVLLGMVAGLIYARHSAAPKSGSGI